MIRFITMTAAAALLAACASNGDMDASASAAAQTTTAPEQSAQPTTPAPSATASGGYTDAQIQSFVNARDQINQLSPGSTTEEQQANQQRIAQILQEQNITADTYNQILRAAQSDQALNNRIAVASVGDSFTDAQLRSFITASAEIQPLNAALSSGTPEERTQAAEQVRAILARNGLDIETYNGIAAQIRSNPELQARLNALASANAGSDSPSGTE